MKKIILIGLCLVSSLVWAQDVGNIKVDRSQIANVIDSMVQQGMISAADAQKAKQEMLKMNDKQWGEVMKGAQKAIKEKDPKIMNNLPKVNSSAVK